MRCKDKNKSFLWLIIRWVAAGREQAMQATFSASTKTRCKGRQAGGAHLSTRQLFTTRLRAS